MADFTQEQMEIIRKEFFLNNPGGRYRDNSGQVLQGMSAFEAYVQDNRRHYTEQFMQEKEPDDYPQPEISENHENSAEDMDNEDIYRERSTNSDENEFLLDVVKLDVLKDMDVISQEIYEAGIKSPSAAIEKLNTRRPLNDKEAAEFEQRLSDKMLKNDRLFLLLPPKMLAEQYTAYNEKIAAAYNKQGEQADISADLVIAGKLAGRMDELSRNLYDKQDIYFADITNISDTYDGYMQMFEAREQYASEEDKEVIIPLNNSNRHTLGEIIGEYDKDRNLEDISENNAGQLNERFEALSQVLPQTAAVEENLKLISNFKFINDEGQIEPQFISEKGEKSDVWQPGSRIMEDSKLENILRIARHNVLMNRLGSKDEIKIENLNAEVNEELLNVLYAAHTANQVENGVKENPNQFTDKKYRERFLADLSNPEKPMGVSATAYEATVDSSINSVGAYAHRLAAKIGKDKQVVTKLFAPLKDLDKRAADRTTNSVDKRAVRIEMLKRTAKMGLSAFAVSGAITVAATATAADASLTAATLGMNKYAGMALGSALAVTMSIRQIHRWNKERKAAGEKRGLKAMLKDRRMMATLGTTVLGAAALGFAATGNPGTAQALGYGAMALGTANGVINSYQDSTKAGLSGWEAAGWAVLQTGVTVGAGFAGRWAANQGIDLYNRQNPENEIFQHRAKIGEHTETSTHTTLETVYKPGVVENAQKILDSWYTDNPDLLQQRIEAIEAYNAEHGTNINPQRYLLAAHDAGALTADNNLLHVQDGPDIHSNANHKVFGQGWSQSSGVSQETVNTLAGSVNGSGVNLSPEAIKAFQEIDPQISATNQVGHVAGNPHQNDGVLGFNAEVDAQGRAVASGQGSQYTTYADHTGPTEQIVHEEVIETKVDDYGMVRNETNLGLGMFGVLGRKSGAAKLKDRIGALADSIFGKNNKVLPEPIPVIPVVSEEQKQLPAHKEPIAALPQHTETGIENMLDKEYRIVHGIEPDDKERLRYRGLVQKEMRADNMGADNLGTYLQKRMSKFEQTLMENVSPLDDSQGFADTTKGKIYINKTRETMWKTNLTADGQPLESKNVTLLHFEKLAGVGKNNAEHAKIKAAEDRRRTPASPGKYDRPHGGCYDVTAVAMAKSGMGR